MKWQVAILSRISQKGDIARNKLTKIIQPISNRQEAIDVAETLSPHIFPSDAVLVYDETSEDKKVIYKYDFETGVSRWE